MNEDPRIGGSRQGGSNWKLWLAGIAALILAIFVFQNSQEVEVDFLFVETQTPLIFGLLAAGLLGFLIGWLLPIVRRGRHADRRED